MAISQICFAKTAKTHRLWFESVKFGPLQERQVDSTIVNRIDGLETRYNNNITHYLCYSTFIHKYSLSPSRVYCILAKSTNSNFQFTLLFESRIGNFPKALLLVSWAKIQYTRDGEGPDLWINEDLRRISSPRTKLLAARCEWCMSTFIQSQC
jgi:hypothetical protein